jgi:hypothetical protein
MSNFFQLQENKSHKHSNRMDPETAQACLCLKSSWFEQGKIE